MKRLWEINRRACLRGAGTVIGLPLLEAMLPGRQRAARAGATRPKRLVFFVFNIGTPDTRIMTTGTGGTDTKEGRPGSFWPTTLGTDFEITTILEPLRDLRQDVLVIRDLSNTLAELPLPNGQGHNAVHNLLSGVELQNTGDNGLVTRAGITVDQFAANALKQFTPAVPSLFLSHPVGRNHENSWMSWSDPTSMIFPIPQPLEAFKKIFGDNTVDEKTRKKGVAYRQSVLHHVKAHADRLQKKLGKADKETLNKYLASVLSLEQQVLASGMTSTCATPGGPPKDTDFTPYAPDPKYPDYFTGTELDLPAHMKKMSDLVTLAFQCDVTRVVSIQLNNGALRFKWLGATYDKDPGDWHGYATHAASPNGDPALREAGLDMYREGCQSQVAMFADLVRKLKNTPEGDGSTLLDNTILVCCSEMSYGNGHNMRHVPVIVAGGSGGGMVRTGRYIAAPPPEQPIYNLWVSMLNAVGIEVTSFGQSTGSIALT